MYIVYDIMFNMCIHRDHTYIAQKMTARDDDDLTVSLLYKI